MDAIAETREALLVVLLNAKKIDAFTGPSNPALMTDAQFKAATEGLNKLLAEAKITSLDQLKDVVAGTTPVEGFTKRDLDKIKTVLG